MSVTSGTIAGVRIPDSALAKEATELVREAATPLVFDHSRQVFLFGALRGRGQGLDFDPELLYVGAMFHDLGLTGRFRRTDRRFEIDGADEARRFLATHGITGDPADRVWTAIALHTTPEIPLHMAPEVALVTRASSWTSSASATTPSPTSSARPWSRPIRARTSRTGSSPRSPRASGTARRQRSATSRRTCWRTTCPVSSAETSWRSSRGRAGRSDVGAGGADRISAFTGRAMRTSSGRGGEGQRYALTSDEDDADFWGSAREAEGSSRRCRTKREHAGCAS